jgi:hypothetical protein
MPPKIKADPQYLPRWMKGMAEGSNDQSARDSATLGMASVQSDLVAHGLKDLQQLPYFPQRVVRQCTALNAHLPDPDGEAVRSFSTPDRPVSREEGARINAAIKKSCA